jgi:hypothetical protein
VHQVLDDMQDPSGSVVTGCVLGAKGLFGCFGWSSGTHTRTLLPLVDITWHCRIGGDLVTGTMADGQTFRIRMVGALWQVEI